MSFRAQVWAMLGRNQSPRIAACRPLGCQFGCRSRSYHRREDSITQWRGSVQPQVRRVARLGFTFSCSGVSSTHIRRSVKAPRAAVHRALRDARAVATWIVPNGMMSHGFAFDAREAGSFRILLTFEAPAGTGKTTAHTDTCHLRFVALVPNELVVDLETTDPALRNRLTITISRADAGGGTDVLAMHDRLPRGLSTADNEAGRRSTLAKPAALVEAGQNVRGLLRDPGQST